MKPTHLASALGLLAALAFTGLAAEPEKPATAPQRVWRKLDVPAGENCFALTFDPADPKRALLGTRPGSLWESLDGGVDQEASAALIRRLKEINKDKASPELNADYEKVLKGQPLDGGFMKGWVFDLRMAATQPDLLFAATSTVLIKSTDAGKSWRNCPTVWGPRSVAIHPRDPKIVVASGTYQVWITRDGGDRWTDVSRDLGSPPADDPKKAPHTQFLTFDPSGQRIFDCTRAGV